jgi:hypothetical protein
LASSHWEATTATIVPSLNGSGGDEPSPDVGRIPLKCVSFGPQKTKATLRRNAFCEPFAPIPGDEGTALEPHEPDSKFDGVEDRQSYRGKPFLKGLLPDSRRGFIAFFING